MSTRLQIIIPSTWYANKIVLGTFFVGDSKDQWLSWQNCCMNYISTDPMTDLYITGQNWVTQSQACFSYLLVKVMNQIIQVHYSHPPGWRVYCSPLVVSTTRVNSPTVGAAPPTKGIVSFVKWWDLAHHHYYERSDKN